MFFDDFDKEIIERIYHKKEIFSKKKINNFIEEYIYINKLKYSKKVKKYKNYEIYGYDFSIFGKIFSRYDLNLIEDGIGYYEKILPKYKISKLKKIKQMTKNFIYTCDFKDFGFNKRVKNIYLTSYFQSYNLPEKIERKKILLNLKKMWNKKSKVEKDYIINIFGITREEIEILNKGTIILFTQPLSEDKCISEKEKINIYREILKKYKEKEVVIKPHPREKTNYKDHFPKYCILEENVPIELLILNGLEIKKAVTLFSTAVFGLEKDTEIDFYGTEVHPNILKRFGSMDHIMKRNKFL